MHVGVKTDVGRVRRANEDAYWVSPPWFAVADGMGGHAAGEVASELAIESVRQILQSSTGAAEELIPAAVRHANATVWHRSRSEPALKGMGTTLTLLKLESGRCVIGHVGDSRCYLFRGKTLRQLTDDHSVVAELVRTGTLSANEALEHPQRNLLTRALGVGPDVKPDILIEEVQPGDKLVLCTDGLTSMLSDDELCEIVSSSLPPDTLASRLVHRANERGGSDNITVVIIQLEG